MLIIKNRIAGGAVPAYTFVKPGGTAGTAVQATAATDKVIGVSTDVDSVLGERMDVIHLGPAKVIAGAAFADGDLLMSDASGRAILAAAAAGSNVRICAQAREAATAAGDIVEVNIFPASFQG
jgi:hypothetical protein